MAQKTQRLGGTHRATQGRIVLLALSGVVACEFPVSPSKYTKAKSDAAALDAQPSARLIEAFSEGDSECAKELESSCSANLKRCASTPGCEDFATCVLDEATPAAPTTCGDELGTTMDARWSYENLRACFSERYQACSIGSSWGCIGRYDAPSTERSELTLSQTLTYFDQAALAADFDVRICGAFTDCSAPIAHVKTDEKGRYTVTLPVGVAPGRPGSAWQGYRRIKSPRIGATRIEQNIPVWGDHVDVTRVVASDQIESLQRLSGAERKEAIFIQVLDCKSTPAANVRLTLTNSGTGSIDYPYSPTKVTSPLGAAAAYDLELDREIRLTGEVVNDDLDVALELSAWRGSIGSGEVVYVKMLPEPR